jgi:glutaconate CoA-transferase subunit A
VTAIAHVPGGCYPSYAAGYSERDNDYYEAWDDLSRDRQVFEDWLEHQVYEQARAR